MLHWSRPLLFRLKEYLEDEHTGRLSRVALGSLVAMYTLSYVFLKNSFGRNIDWMDFIGYATGMALAASPELAAKFIVAKFRSTFGGDPSPSWSRPPTRQPRDEYPLAPDGPTT